MIRNLPSSYVNNDVPVGLRSTTRSTSFNATAPSKAVPLQNSPALKTKTTVISKAEVEATQLMNMTKMQTATLRNALGVPAAVQSSSMSSDKLGLRRVQANAAIRSRSAAPSIGRILGPSIPATSPAMPQQSIRNLPCVLFLDVDGVLHGVQGQFARQQFQRPQMNILAEILKATNCKIVLSSAWRVNPMARNVVDKTLRMHGIPTFVSRTPNIGTFQRAREILAWVTQYQPKTWVAIDDWDLHLEGQEKIRGHFVRTNARLGLTRKDYDSVIEQFRRQANGETDMPSASALPSDLRHIPVQRARSHLY
eukprot:GEMP01013996.1.p1 GENE.GEMP01013996.1~~GEMP01013996.1.p1  ORF type:complete len:309 (+),score=51.69 GEMP01013996.1:142-1068(+)